MPSNTKVVPLKVWVQEHEKWKRAADASGARSFNAWGRERLNEAADMDLAIADDLAGRREARAQLRADMYGDDAA